MNQRGRKSGAALAVADHTQVGMTLRAPAGLSEAERGVWLVTVNSKPADWFGLEHVPVLVEYCRHVCRGHVIDEQLRAFDAEWLATDEGLKRFEKLSSVAVKTTGMVVRLASSMRLSQQSMMRHEKVIPKTGRKLWQREPKASPEQAVA